MLKRAIIPVVMLAMSAGAAWSTQVDFKAAEPAPLSPMGALPVGAATQDALRIDAGAFAPIDAVAPAAAEPEEAPAPEAAVAALPAQVKVDKFLARYLAPFAESRVDLSKIDPSDVSVLGKRAESKAVRKLIKDQLKLDKLQQKLYADGKRSVLIVLQGMDTAGKDGTIRHVMRSMTPQGVEVQSFKKPSVEEASHPFLWRIEKALVDKGIVTKDMKGNGRVGIFNRSHYEDILVPSVYKTFSKEEVAARYEIINQWEKKLAENGVVIIKLFLHISKDEQKARLQARLDDPDKNWKFSKADLESRKKWGQFHGVYEKILARTNTPWAPWYVIPANNKWYRDFVSGRILKKTMKALHLSFPPAPDGLEDVVIK